MRWFPIVIFPPQRYAIVEKDAKRHISGWPSITRDFIPRSWPPPQTKTSQKQPESVTGRGIDEGTYGVVYRACEIDSGEVVALKQLKLGAVKSEEGFPVPGPGLPGLGGRRSVGANKIHGLIGRNWYLYLYNFWYLISVMASWKENGDRIGSRDGPGMLALKGVKGIRHAINMQQILRRIFQCFFWRDSCFLSLSLSISLSLFMDFSKHGDALILHTPKPMFSRGQVLTSETSNFRVTWQLNIHQF